MAQEVFFGPNFVLNFQVVTGNIYIGICMGDEEDNLDWTVLKIGFWF